MGGPVGAAPERGGRPPLGGPAVLELRQDRGAERAVALDPASAAPGPVGRHSLVGSPGWWTHCGSVLDHRDGARSLPQFGGEKCPVVCKRAISAVFKGDMCIVASHGNTLTRCCTSFVNLGDPVLFFRKAEEKAKALDPLLDPRLKMSRMTGGVVGDVQG